MAPERVAVAEDHLTADGAGIERVVGTATELDLPVVADQVQHAAVAAGVAAVVHLDRGLARRGGDEDRRLAGADDVGRVQNLQLAEDRRAGGEDQAATVVDDHLAVRPERQVALAVPDVVVDDAAVHQAVVILAHDHGLRRVARRQRQDDVAGGGDVALVGIAVGVATRVAVAVEVVEQRRRPAVLAVGLRPRVRDLVALRTTDAVLVQEHLEERLVGCRQRRQRRLRRRALDREVREAHLVRDHLSGLVDPGVLADQAPARARRTGAAAGAADADVARRRDDAKILHLRPAHPEREVVLRIAIERGIGERRCGQKEEKAQASEVGHST